MTQKYIPTKWVANETIGTANVMNNIEQGIVNAHNKVDDIKNTFEDCSLGETGYCRLPNGLLLQWGTFHFGVGSTTETWYTKEVQFPIPFNTLFTVNMSRESLDQWDFSLGVDLMFNRTGYTNSKFELVVKLPQKESSIGGRWFAIGI